MQGAGAGAVVGGVSQGRAGVAEVPLPAGATPAAGGTTLALGLVLVAAALGTAACTYR